MGPGRLCLVVAFAAASLCADDKATYLFGTTVVDSSGLHGRVYYLEPGSERLPDFERMKPVGSVYTNTLNVWPQHFNEGFPNVTERFEWFAIEYTGKVWIETPGQYRFSLLADDGATLKLNDKMVINNDGIHAAMAVSGGAMLTRGVHDIKIEYFQGPRFTVALVLSVAAPGEPWRIFNMNDFKPPKEVEQWTKGSLTEIHAQTIGQAGDSYSGRRKRKH